MNSLGTTVSVQVRNNEALRGWQQPSEGENGAKED